MRAKLILCATIAVFSLVLGISGSWAATVYVDINSTSSAPDGKSWNKAFMTPQEGIDAAGLGDEVWVADGVYLQNVSAPDTPIVMKNGVSLFGGFSGEEKKFSQRDPSQFLSILDGNANGRVISISNCPSNMTRVDGFVIRNGNASLYEGGGIRIDASAPVINGNVIRSNYAQFGAGISCYSGSSPQITANTIDGNSGNYGVGIAIEDSTALVMGNIVTANSGPQGNGGGIRFLNSTGSIETNYIANNQSSLGAGISTWNSPCTIKFNIITYNHPHPSYVTGGGTGIFCYGIPPVEISGNEITFNTGSRVGGGIAFEQTIGSETTIANNLIVNNSAYEAGPGLSFMSASAEIVNNTIADNSSSGAAYDGAIYNHGSSLTIANNIIAFNSSGIYWTGWGSIVLAYNDFFGNIGGDYPSYVTPGVGDISEDPSFVDRLAENYHISDISPCRNAGDNAYVGIDWLDMDGESRIMEDIVDMGADEYYGFSECPDNDSDGWTVCDGDCNDSDPDINPGMKEIGKWKKDGKDNDCNGIIDG